MQKIKMLNNIKLNKRDVKKNEVIEVANNIAHGLIDSGDAKLFMGTHRMYVPSKKKRYITK